MIILKNSDCLEALDRMPENSVDAVCTDGPYHLTSIVKRFGKEGSAPAKSKQSGVYSRSSKGFMGKEWDGGDILFQAETWSKILRVLKPGGFVLSFAATRNYHRMVTAMDDAGFIIRDMIAWTYGTGFPKSVNISLHIDKMLRGYPQGSFDPDSPNHGKWKKPADVRSAGLSGMIDNGIIAKRELLSAAEQWKGFGTALKPSIEPICLAQKPFSEKTIAKNVLENGVGGLNIDGCRIGTEEKIKVGRRSEIGGGKKNQVYGKFKKYGNYQLPKEGRWPANFIHDGSDQLFEIFKEQGVADAYRFFYCAKPSGEERKSGNGHPTMKPISLMQYLVRLVTPPQGVVLDPFMGTGTTGIAAVNENLSFVGIEREPDYFATSYRRIMDAKRQKVVDGLCV